MGVIFFIYNAVFALILLLMVLISSGLALFTKNPDTRYQPMRDDRGSFIKSQTQLTTELDALGATARGEGKGNHYRSRAGIDDDDDSFSSSSMERNNLAAKEGLTTPASGPEGYREPPRSPVDPSMPMFPSNAETRTGPPSYYGRSNNPSPQPRAESGYSAYSNQQFGRAASVRSEVGALRAQNNSSPWQRGAGYDH